MLSQNCCIRLNWLKLHLCRFEYIVSRVRLLAYAKYALYGLSPKLKPQSDYGVKVVLSRLKTNVSYLQLRLVLEILELLSLMENVRHFLRVLSKRFVGAIRRILTLSLSIEFKPN
ncbi:hypothetical protein RGQ29_011524 [Quercus rubra]|uniref:Uncharacterized protein n=1 Tax=Quercus rubra TaxID=3512 RepID=A0AAN7G6F4_QUERU|nr:hypothetical protein RGQ29_011524 [Quercus rubra]